VVYVSISFTYSAIYFPSKLTDSVEMGFAENRLYPILFQLLMSTAIVKMLCPFTSVQNRKGLVPSLEKRQHSIFSSRDFVKLISGDPSLIFHILAEPSMDVETKNSESDVHVTEGFVSFRFVQHNFEIWPMKYSEMSILTTNSKLGTISAEC